MRIGKSTKNRNPGASALRDPRFRQRVVKNKKAYSRKGINRGRKVLSNANVRPVF